MAVTTATVTVSVMIIIPVTTMAMRVLHLSTTPRQNHSISNIHDEAQTADDEHQSRLCAFALGVLRLGAAGAADDLDAAEHALVDDDADEAPHEHDGEERPDDLGPLEAEGELLRCLPLRGDDGEEREGERPDVGEHVRRVGHDCQRVGEDAGHELDDHKDDAEDDGDDERGLGADVLLQLLFCHGDVWS